MATHTRGPRKRTRKSRSAAPADGSPSGVDHAPTTGAVRPAKDSGGTAKGVRKRSAGAGKKTSGDRPQAPWHPLPLSELLIFAGGIGAAIAVLRGPAHSGPLLLAGIGAVALGTIEVSWREHRSGFRSHAMLLAVLPVMVLHTAVVLIVGAFTTPPRILVVGFLAVDAALFFILSRMLRVSYVEARARLNRR